MRGALAAPVGQTLAPCLFLPPGGGVPTAAAPRSAAYNSLAFGGDFAGLWNRGRCAKGVARGAVPGGALRAGGESHWRYSWSTILSSE